RRLDKIFEFISKPSDNLTLIGHLKRAAAFGRKRIELKEFVNETRKKINRQLEWSIWEESKYLEERKRFGINILENIHHSMNQGDGLGSLITLIDMLEYHKQETDDGKFILSGEIINTLNQTASTVRSWMQNMLKIPVMLRKEYETEFLSEEEINRIIDESIESLDEFKKIKNHTILKDQMEIPFRIQANREVMEISIKELITNAFKYSPTDSEIRIFSQRAGNSLSILISNTVNHIEGSLTGIPRELENRLFEPFVRVNNLHDDRYHKDTFGMGTGLTLVYHSISQVGGKLYLYESHSAENNSNGSKKVIAEMIFPIDHSVSQESSSD
ncbi:MAG: ATP-binding protein, partial [Spirochaetia bacterium]|nr:ATP-binding protein [Spirochaetia bacterium]